MAHTPGPWVVVNGTAVAPQWAPRERVAKTIAVNLRADEDGAFPEVGEWQHADARLIAAAPELLDALKESLDVMGEWGDDGDPAWASRARAAIAKAEGRTDD